MARGKLITVEGIEGVGKSTQIERLVTTIESAGIAVLRTREPGGTPVAEQIRKVVLGHADEPITATAEMLLMFAARSLLVENAIRPALAEGRWVVSDRFVDASRAYQGGGRGLPIDRVETLAEWVLGELAPDLTVLLDAPVHLAMARTRSRGAEDRMDSEQTAFYERVREAYLDLAASEADRFVVVDASDTVDEVARQIDAAVQKLLSKS